MVHLKKRLQMKREMNKEMQAAGRTGSSSHKKADPELNCTDHQTQHSQESIFPVTKSLHETKIG